MVDGKHIYGSPFKRIFVPGALDRRRVFTLEQPETVIRYGAVEGVRVERPEFA